MFNKLWGPALPAGIAKDEFRGTAFLNTGIKATAVAAVLGRPIAGQALDSSAVFLGAGFTLMVLALFNGKCHYNSGLTVAAACAKQINWQEVPRRCLAQLLGVAVSDLLILGLYLWAGRNTAHFGASLPGKGAVFGSVLLAEFALSYAFYYITLRLAPMSSLRPIEKAFGIGFALGVGILVAGPVSGGALNPAIGFVPLLLSWYFRAWPLSILAYVVMPLIAGLLAGLNNRKHTAEQQTEGDKPTYLRNAEVD